MELTSDTIASHNISDSLHSDENAMNSKHMSALLHATAAMTPGRMFGAHMPTAGGLHKSLLGGSGIGCDVVQLFTANPKQWTHAPLSAEIIKNFRDAQASTGIANTVAHDSYLINLAAPTPAVLEKSQIAFREELDRAQQLGIPWVVTHMGAHLDQGEDEAMSRLVASLKQVLEDTDREGYTVGIALETTAGQGTGLGWRFEQLGQILREVGPTPRLGVCLDTCHIFAAGYDLRDADAYSHTFTEFDRIVGLNNLKVIHANDCQKPLGCRVDRHAHIGEGQIGSMGFALLATDLRLAHIPMLVETPDSDAMHRVNIGRLRQMAQTGRDPDGTVPTFEILPSTVAADSAEASA